MSVMVSGEAGESSALDKELSVSSGGFATSESKIHVATC